MNGLKMKIFWCLIFLFIVFAITEPATNEDEFDVIEESVLQDILSDSEYSADLDKLVDRYLKGLMLRHRSKVLQLYRKYTCSSHGDLCDTKQLLQLLPISSEFDKNIFQHEHVLGFQLTSLKQTEICLLPFVPSFLSISKLTFQSSLLLASAIDDPNIYIYYIPEKGACVPFGYVQTSMATPCLHSVSITDQVELVIAWPCKINNGLIHIYMVASKGIELFQLLDADKVDQIVDFTYGSKHYLCLIKADDCILYEWVGTNFELVSNTIIIKGVNYPLKQFVYGSNHFLLAIGKALFSRLDPALAVWKLEMNDDNLKIELYQLLTDCKTSDFHLFEFGGMHFVAVACAEDAESYLYWWSGSQFLMWQVIAVGKRTKQWKSLSLDNGESTLIAVHFNEKEEWLSAYSLRQGHYHSTNAKSDPTDMSVKIVKDESVQLLTVESRSIFSYKLTMKAVENKWRDPIDQCVDNLEKMMARQTVINAEINKKLAQYQSNKNPDLEYSTDCGRFSVELVSIENRLKMLETDFHNWKQASGHYIGLRVNELVVNNLNANRVTVSEELVSGINLTELHRSVLTASTNQTFDSSIAFENGINVKILETSSTVNGVKYENIATNAKHLTFTRPQTFNTLNVNNVKIDGKINGVNTTDWVQNGQKRTVMHGRKTFKNLNIYRNLRLHEGTINDVNVVHFFSTVLKKNGGKVQSDTEVRGNVFVKDQLLAKLINNVDVNHLVQNAVTISTDQYLHGCNRRIEQLNVENLEVNGKLNGVRAPFDLLTFDTEQHVPNSVTLNGKVRVAGDVIVISDVVNGFKDWSKAVVTRFGSHTITGRKLFIEDVLTKGLSFQPFSNAIQHFSNVTVNHLTVQSLNNIDVYSLLLNSVVLSRANAMHGYLGCANVRFDGPVSIVGEGSLDQLYMTKRTKQNIFTPLIVGSDVIIYGTTWLEKEMNGFNLKDIPRNCLMKTGDQSILEHINVASAVFLKDVQLFDYDSLLDQLLYQVNWRLRYLELSRDVHLEGDLDCQYLNGIDLDSFISELYSRNGNHLQLQGKVFQQLQVLGNFDLNTRLNGLNTKEFLNDIVRLSTDQVITGDLKIMRPVLCESMETEAVNGLNLNEHLNRLVQVDSSGVVNQHVTFTNGLHVSGDADIRLLDNKNIFNILDDMILESTQEFKTSITLNGKVTIGELKVLGTINDVNPFDWIRLDDNRTFNGHVTFKSAVNIAKLKVHMSTSRKAYNRYHKYSLIDAKKVELRGLINGLNIADLPSKLIQLNRPQVVSHSLVVFHGNVTVDHLVTAHQPVVNGVKLNDIINRGLSMNTTQTLMKMVQFTESSVVHFADVMEVKGSWKFPQFASVGANCSSNFYDGWTHFGKMIFENVFIKDNPEPVPVEVHGDAEANSVEIKSVNGIDLMKLIANRVTLSTNQKIPTEVHIKGSMSDVVGCQNSMDFNPVIKEDVEFKCPVLIRGFLRARKNFTLNL